MIARGWLSPETLIHTSFVFVPPFSIFCLHCLYLSIYILCVWVCVTVLCVCVCVFYNPTPISFLTACRPSRDLTSAGGVVSEPGIYK